MAYIPSQGGSYFVLSWGLFFLGGGGFIFYFFCFRSCFVASFLVYSICFYGYRLVIKQLCRNAFPVRVTEEKSL